MRPNLLARLHEIYATTTGTDDTISALWDSVDELERTARDIESINNMLHELLTRLERNMNRVDSRLRRIEDEQQKTKKQTQQEAERGVKRVHESEDGEEKEKRQRVASGGLMTNITGERRQQRILEEQAKKAFAGKTWSYHFGTN